MQNRIVSTRKKKGKLKKSTFFFDIILLFLLSLLFFSFFFFFCCITEHKQSVFSWSSSFFLRCRISSTVNIVAIAVAITICKLNIHLESISEKKKLSAQLVFTSVFFIDFFKFFFYFFSFSNSLAKKKKKKKRNEKKFLDVQKQQKRIQKMLTILVICSMNTVTFTAVIQTKYKRSNRN